MLNRDRINHARLRLAHYYAKFLVETSSLYLKDGVVIFYVLKRLDAEFSQIDQTLVWLSENASNNAEVASLFMNTVGASRHIFPSRFSPTRCKALHEQALHIAQRLGDIPATLTHLIALAYSQRLANQIADEYAHLLQARQFAEQGGYTEQLAETLYRLSYTYANLGRYEEALETINQALELYRTFNDVQNINLALLRLGEIAIYKGEWEKADGYLQEAYQLAKRYNQQVHIMRILQEIGELKYRIGQPENSIRYRMESLEIASQMGNQTEVIHILMDLGVTYDYLQNFDMSEQYYSQALKLSKQTGILFYESCILINLGYTAYRKNNYVTALQYMETAIRMFQEEQTINLEFIGLSLIVPVYLALDSISNAHRALYNCLQLGLDMDNTQLHVWAIVAAAHLWVERAIQQTDTSLQHKLLIDVVKWMGLVHSTPYAEQQNRDDIGRLRPQLESILGKDPVSALLKEGSQLQIADLLMNLHQQLSAGVI